MEGSLLMSKMYILVKDTVPLGFAINAVAHASLSCYKTFEGDPDMEEWFDLYFNKVTCKVTEEQFEWAKTNCDKHRIITESRLNNQELAIAFCPRSDWPAEFRKFPLYNSGDFKESMLVDTIIHLEKAVRSMTAVLTGEHGD
jgi:hypothetical protein